MSKSKFAHSYRLRIYKEVNGSNFNYQCSLVRDVRDFFCKKMQEKMQIKNYDLRHLIRVWVGLLFSWSVRICVHVHLCVILIYFCLFLELLEFLVLNACNVYGYRFSRVFYYSFCLNISFVTF